MLATGRHNPSLVPRLSRAPHMKNSPVTMVKFLGPEAITQQGWPIRLHRRPLQPGAL